MMSSGVDEDEIRDELIVKLRESLVQIREMTSNPRFDVRTKERWAQIHTTTAQALNRILRDRKQRDWERRLEQVEEYIYKMGPMPRRMIVGLTMPADEGSRGRTLKRMRAKWAGGTQKHGRPQ